MRIFRRARSSTKPDPSAGDESQAKSWGGVFRLFQAKEAADDGAKRPTTAAMTVAAAAAAAAAGMTSTSAANETPDEGASTWNRNQNYTPEVALSPEPLPMSPAVLPLFRPMSDGHNSAAEAAEAKDKAKGLARYEAWQRRTPHFRFGPRNPMDDEADLERRGSGASSAASSATDNILALPPKYAFIYQDGKFVEREVTKWPQPQRAVPHLRYRVLEPYASRYGRRYRKRISSEERIVSVRHRLIYQNPIYRLPRKIMEENKTRLMTRHSLKDSFFDAARKIGGPQKVDVGEREQSKVIKKMQEKHNVKEAAKLVDYVSRKTKSTDKTG